ncbi:hypothetical protein SDC9_131967 [bioreactor metagenome]|uniref:Uncharacterized protein n=1 Tax=bioreactor metagenome TaxID=1076179 RepID=A0A645D6K9_9ZZZZ
MVAPMKAILRSVCDIIHLQIGSVLPDNGEQHLVGQAGYPGTGAGDGTLERAALGWAGRVMDMGLSILDDDVGVPKRALHMHFPVDGKAVAIRVCFGLHLHVPASPAQCPAAEGKNGQNA